VWLGEVVRGRYETVEGWDHGRRVHTTTWVAAADGAGYALASIGEDGQVNWDEESPLAEKAAG
jgi:hypothetical protein